MKQSIEKIPRVEIAVINGANQLRVGAGTNGYKGGDAGHGGVTYFALEDAGGTDIKVTSIEDGVELVVRGDSELTTLIQALEFAVATLKRQSAHSSDLPPKVAVEIEAVRLELDELTSARWDLRQSKSGATPIKELAARISLSARRLESFVKENTFPAA